MLISLVLGTTFWCYGDSDLSRFLGWEGCFFVHALRPYADPAADRKKKTERSNIGDSLPSTTSGRTILIYLALRILGLIYSFSILFRIQSRLWIFVPVFSFSTHVRFHSVFLISSLASAVLGSPIIDHHLIVSSLSCCRQTRTGHFSSCVRVLEIDALA
ncbi:hypothetical protein BDW71DRAFT_152021 [Aspergillus fruticulosus]